MNPADVFIILLISVPFVRLIIKGIKKDFDCCGDCRSCKGCAHKDDLDDHDDK